MMPRNRPAFEKNLTGLSTDVLAGVRAFVDAAQLVAAASLTDKLELTKAATAFAQDLKGVAIGRGVIT